MILTISLILFTLPFIYLIYKDSTISFKEKQSMFYVDPVLYDKWKNTTIFGLTLKEHEEANERIFGKNVLINAEDQEFLRNATKKTKTKRRRNLASRKSGKRIKGSK